MRGNAWRHRRKMRGKCEEGERNGAKVRAEEGEEVGAEIKELRG